MKTKDLTVCALFTCIIIIMTIITIPLIGGVPFTLQTLAVMLTGACIGKKRGFIAVVVYILIGGIGIPVFAGFKGGFGVLLGATGGFILSFPLMAYVVGYFAEINITSKRNIYIGAIIGTLLNFAFGILMFIFITQSTVKSAFIACFVPFIVPSVIKIILTGEFGFRIRNTLLKRFI